jgi:hypothetical protein
MDAAPVIHIIPLHHPAPVTHIDPIASKPHHPPALEPLAACSNFFLQTTNTKAKRHSQNRHTRAQPQYETRLW